MSMNMWYFLFLFAPAVQSYLFGCYYDFGQPLVIAEQLPIGVCTHVLLIGATSVENLDVSIVQHTYNGSDALQSMRDYRRRDSNGLKVIPSLVGDDAQWKAAMVNETKRSQFIAALIRFARTQVDRSLSEIRFCTLHLYRKSMELISIGNIRAEMSKCSSLPSSTNFVSLFKKHFRRHFS